MQYSQSREIVLLIMFSTLPEHQLSFQYAEHHLSPDMMSGMLFRIPRPAVMTEAAFQAYAEHHSNLDVMPGMQLRSPQQGNGIMKSISGIKSRLLWCSAH